jgi:hypothetical protein
MASLPLGKKPHSESLYIQIPDHRTLMMRVITFPED